MASVNQEAELVVETRTKYLSLPLFSESSLDCIVDDENTDFEPEYKFLQPLSTQEVSQQLLHYNVVRAINIVRVGDYTVTLSELLLLHDFDLKDPFVHDILIKYRGIEVLINILELEEVMMNKAALAVLIKVACTNRMRIFVTNKGIMETSIRLLRKPYTDLRILVANLITQLCQLQKPVLYFLKRGGIPALIDVIDIDESILNAPMDLLPEREKSLVLLTIASLEALTKIAQVPKSINFIVKCGFVSLIKKLTTSCHKELVTQTMELLVPCVKVKSIRETVESEGIIATLVEGLADDNERLRAACAHNLAECAAPSKITANVVRMLNGVPTLVDLTRNLKQSEPTLRAITFAVAKLCQDTKNLKIMSERGLVQNLISMVKLRITDNETFANVLEGLAECGRLDENRSKIANSGIIPLVVSRLLDNDPTILTSISMCLGTWARSPDVAELITQFDGLRMLFSAIKHTSPEVAATALWALRPLVNNTGESAEELRSMVGGFTLLINLLNVNSNSVVAQACGVVAEISADEENLRILSESGMVQSLSRQCASAEDDEVRVNLAEAIAAASPVHENARLFGMLGVVNVLRNYLVSKNVMLHIHAMRALAHLTKVPVNCIMLHECDGVAPVLSDVAAPYEELQELATVVLRNMRKVALEAEDKALRDCNLAAFRRKMARVNKSDSMNPLIYEKNTHEFYNSTKRRITLQILE